MKTSITATAIVVCSLLSTTASAQQQQHSHTVHHGSHGQIVQRQVRFSEWQPVGGSAPVQGELQYGEWSEWQPVPGSERHGEWSEWQPVPGSVTYGEWGPWRPVEPRLDRVTPSRPTPTPNSPFISHPKPVGPVGPAPSNPHITPQQQHPKPKATSPLIGEWKSSDRILRVSAGRRFQVIWMNNGELTVDSGTYTTKSSQIHFRSDKGQIWIWTVSGFDGQTLTMSHDEVGQRVFKRQ